ncbi:MAG TPA: helix-turn-helix transcriptional regulator [Gemmatimonadales bacterium]|nr:helix-turn-helix transcriptional regulator [Gemmatimonadales bacterium]
MDSTRQRTLEAAGWTVGSVADFLELSEVEATYVEMKLALSSSLRDTRTRQRLTQAELATQLHSSQSRVAKMEAGDPSVSLDLLMRALLQMGVTPRQIGAALRVPVAR